MQEQTIIVKLRAHKKLIDNTLKSLSENTTFSVPEFMSFVEPFEKYRSELVELNPDLYGDFKPKSYELFFREAYGGFYFISGLTAIADNIQYILDIAPDESSVKPDNFKITNEGIFFAGQYFDAFIKVSEILKGANSEIILIDGYINEQFLDIFTSLNKNVIIKILTKSKSMNASVLLAVSRFNQQYSINHNKLEIKANEEFHDRFLIIDKNEFYHFGASLKDAGNKGFMFSKIEEPIIQTALLQDFNTKW